MQKVLLVAALVIVGALQCAHGQTFTFSFGQVSRTGDEGTDGAPSSTTDIQVPVEITIDPPSAFLSADTIVMVSVSGGSATEGQDFNLSRSEVTFDVGANSGNTISVFVDVLDDLLVEGTESFTLSGAISTTIAAPGSTFVGGGVTVFITDNDFPISLRFSQSSYSQSESLSPLSVSLVLDATSGVAVQSVVAEITASSQAGDTATEGPGTGADYTGTMCTVSFPAGSAPGTTSTLCNIPLISDSCLEEDETFSLTATILNSNGQSAQFTTGGDSASATIIDDDAVTVQLVSSGAGGVGPASQSVQENGADPICCAQLLLTGGVTIKRNIVVTLSTGAGTATAGTDYTPASSIMTFTEANQGQLQCVTISVDDDLICEADETFSCSLTSTEDPSDVILNPSFGLVTIVDNDEVTIGTGQSSYSVTEYDDQQLTFNVNILSGEKGPGRSCVVTVSTLEDSATAPEDYTGLTTTLTFTDTVTTQSLSIDIVDDLVFEPTEHFNISLSTSSDGCVISPGNEIVQVYIMDDEDCTGMAGMPCDENAMCEELVRRDNFTCTCIPPYMGDGFMCSRAGPNVGDDPHFSIALPSGKLLCYTVQGEHGFVFNLISNKMFHMNAMFVPDSRREEVTWLGSMGIIVQNSQYKTSNATYLRFETKGKRIYIGDKVTLLAKNIEKLSFSNGKLTISEATPSKGFRYPSVLVDLHDVGLNFTIKFMNEHLDLFWHSTGKSTKNSHGIIGQFFRRGVEIDETRKILILPGKEPVPVMRRPVWSFMEREVADDQLCWTAMNPGYQGEGLIDGTYFDYLVNSVLSTDFKFKKQQ